MSDSTSALYTGTVLHQRIKPRAHRLKYELFSLLIDLDDLDRLASRLRFFSKNRFNLFSFYDTDFGDKTATPIRQQIERYLCEAGLYSEGGSIRLFAMPRVLGYAFNPLSVYFCYRPEGALGAIIYEVHNTFGERHAYLIPVSNDGVKPIRQHCAKRLYVSPFMDMDLTYSFQITPPGEKIGITILTQDAEGPVLNAVLTAQRQPLTDAALLRVFFVYPLLTLKVIAGIHWEALLIWFKGMRIRKRPPPPERPVTLTAAPAAKDTPHRDLPLHVLH